MRKIALLALVAFSVTFYSCKKKDPCDGKDLRYDVTGDRAYQAGDTIRLQATNIPGATFKWTGPQGPIDNYGSHELEVPAYTMNYAGTYSVYYSGDDDCIDHTENVPVTLTAPVAPCHPQANHIKYASYNEGMGGIWDENYKQIRAGSSNTDLDVFFVSMPVTGVYNIVDGSKSSFDMAPTDVQLQITSFYYYYADGGKLYVTVENGKLTVSFCDITFGPFDGNEGSVTVDY